MVKKRVYAAIRIQSCMRRFRAAKKVGVIRGLKNAASVIIEKMYRGHIVRLRLKIYRAACRLQKFMKLIHFFRFKDAVIMVMQLRRMFYRRIKAATTIQRVYRGFSVRYDIFRDVLMHFIEKRAKRRICKAIWRFSFVLKKRKIVKIVSFYASRYLF